MSTTEKQKKIKPSYIVLGVILAGVLLIPALGGDGARVLMHLVITMCVYIVLGQSWNVLAGMTGLFSLGQAAFYGIGGYSLAISIVKLKLGPVVGILLGLSLACLLAVVLGAVSSRLGGLFFAIATEMLAKSVNSIVTQWTKMTNGTNGIPIPSKLNLSREVFFYVAILFAAAAVFFYWWLRRSRLGSMFVSIRENQNLSSSLGVNTTKYKTYASIISSLMAALAGMFMAYYVRVIDPNFLGDDVFNRILIIVIVGGTGTLWGPVLGSSVVLLEEMIKSTLGATYAPVTIIIYSLVLIIVMLVRPKGIISINVKKSLDTVLKSLGLEKLRKPKG